MKRFYLSNLLAIFATVLLCSCGGDDIEDPNGETTKDSLTPLSVSQKFLTDGMTFDSVEDAKTFHFKSGTTWTATLDFTEDEENSDPWCTIDKMEGEAGNSAITVHCMVNKTNQDRTATLTISNKSSSIRILITQAYETFLQLSEYDVVVSDSSHLVSIGVTYNVDHYSLEIPSEASSWIHPVNTRAKKESIENFQIDPNPHPARIAPISFHACNRDGNILFTQYLYISQISAPSYLIGRQESFAYNGTGKSELKYLENGSYKNKGEENFNADFIINVSDSLATIEIPSLTLNGGTLRDTRLSQLVLSENEDKMTELTKGFETSLSGSFTLDGKTYPISDVYLEITANAWEMNIALLEIYFGENNEYVLSIKYIGKRE